MPNLSSIPIPGWVRDSLYLALRERPGGMMTEEIIDRLMSWPCPVELMEKWLDELARAGLIEERWPKIRGKDRVWVWVTQDSTQGEGGRKS